MTGAAPFTAHLTATTHPHPVALHALNVVRTVAHLITRTPDGDSSQRTKSIAAITTGRTDQPPPQAIPDVHRHLQPIRRSDRPPGSTHRCIPNPGTVIDGYTPPDNAVPDGYSGNQTYRSKQSDTPCPALQIRRSGCWSSAAPSGASPTYRCKSSHCLREVFAHNTSRLTRPAWSTTRRCARYILRRLMIDRMTISAVARELGVSWDTVNTIAMDATQMIVAADTTRLDGVRVSGVDEHRWSHTRHTDGFVTVTIDLTPVLDGTGRARLLDLVAGRSAAALRPWLANQSPQFRDQVEVVAMDGFGGYKTAAADQLPEATAVMDPFHVVALAGAKLDLTRQRVQQQTCGHRGRTGDPLYGVRRTLRTRFPLLSSRQQARLTAVFADDNHLAVLVTWSIYQRFIAAYCQPDCRRGKAMLASIIDSLRRGVPAGLEELAQLGRTLHRRRHDVLAYFDHHAYHRVPHADLRVARGQRFVVRTPKRRRCLIQQDKVRTKVQRSAVS